MGNLCSSLADKTRSLRKSHSFNQTMETSDENNQSSSENSIEKRVIPQSHTLTKTKEIGDVCENGKYVDRPIKCITFADAPEYFKLKMADDISEIEKPNCQSFTQKRIDVREKVFDSVALAVCKKTIVSFDTLMFQLIHENVNVKNEMDKVRAIFTWLTNKNTTEAHFDYLNNGQGCRGDGRESPDVYLHGLCTGRYTYAQFFQLLCKLAGIRCKLLRGYAKGNDFKPGMKLEGGKAAQHAWNSVEIDGIWYLFDTHWTARRLAGRNSTTNANSSTKLDLFYFMIHPDDMMYSHFPFDESWQLQKNPISLEAFEKLVIVKPAFFKYGLKFSNQTEAIITTTKDVQIDLEYPITSDKEKTAFTYTISINGDKKDTIKDVPLTRYGMQRHIKKDLTRSKVRFWMRFPETGSYKIMIFAKSEDDQLFSGVCEYLVRADIDPNGQKVVPFPPTQQACYGKTELLSKYEITSSWNDEAIITLDKPTFDISFKSLKKPGYSNCPRVMARLKNNNKGDPELSKRILIRVMAPTSNDYESGTITSEIIKIKGFLPESGEYALEIYANHPDTEASSFFLVWQHLILHESHLINTFAPVLSPGFVLGAHERFKELSLRALTHPDPLIVCDENSGDAVTDVRIKIGIPVGRILTLDTSKKQGIRVIGQLLLSDQDKSDEETDSSNLMLQQAYMYDNASQEVEFLIRFDGVSEFYRLHIYAMSLESDLDSVPLAMTYLIQLNPNVLHSSLKGFQLGEFPHQTSQWKEDCRLICPLERILKLHKTKNDDSSAEKFTLIVPQAMKIAAVINEDWFQFSKSEEIIGQWLGTVTLASSLQPGTLLTIFANFNSHYNSYIPLLEYILQ